jgi:hypothetical protein
MEISNINDFFYNIFFITLYIAILILFIVLIVNRLFAWQRNRYEKREQFKLTFLQVKVPPDNEIEVKEAEHLFSSLMGFRKPFFQSLFAGQYRISFEIVSKTSGIGFYVVVPNEIVSLVEKQINGAYPSAEIDIINPNEIWDRGKYTAVKELKLAGAPYYPINTYEDLKSDALSEITSSLSKLKDDEVLAIQYVLSPASDNWRRAGERFITSIKSKAADPEKKVNVDTAFLEKIENKISKPGFDVSVRIVSIAGDKVSADSHIRNVIASFEQFTNIKYNRFVKRRMTNSKKLIKQFIYRKLKITDWYIPLLDISLYRNVSVLNIEEMATIFHFPNNEIKTPNIIWLHARKASAPTNLPGEGEGLYLGKSVFRGVEKRVFMLDDDRRRHFYIIGQTGTGKSQLMQFLAMQDIHAGKGVAFIDPHGSDIEDMLQKIPPNRIDDVILFDVADTERPMGLNLLEASSEEEKNMLINAFIGLLYKLYDPNKQGIMGPQLERAIRNVMLTAMTDPEATMVDVMRLLIDDKYIEKFLPNIADPLVKRYWTDEQAKTTANRKGEMMGYFVSKFDRLVTERFMRNIIGQPKSSFNFHEIMAQKKILLVDLSKGKIGEENSNFLGLLLVPRILSAALARATLLGKEEFPDFYLYVDEFQNFATPDFATILSEARKYKLNLTVAHQFIEQLTDEIKDAVFGNVGTITSFRVGPDDGEYLEQQFEPVFTQSDLSNLPVGHCYVKLLVKGHPTVPFSMTVDWDTITATTKDPSVAVKIKEMSRMRYGTPAAEVEEFINMRAGLNETETSPEDSAQKARDPNIKIPF